MVEDAERRATTAALRRLLRPRRIAVVGASRDRAAIGAIVLDNLLTGGFRGEVYPVNPNAARLQGVVAYPSLRACPATPDLVVVCVPAPFVAGVVEEAGQLGVGAVCVISAGFAEVDDAGARRQAEVLDRARAHGVRLVGPNGMGVLNGADDVRMNATFSRVFPASGAVSMSSQSGALGLAVLEHLDRLGLGVASFVSVGNKADVSGNDLLLYWDHDDATRVILLYLESFGNPRRFARIAREVARHKPIVAVKSGRGTSGARAASSHTAAIAAGEPSVEALFRQAGVIRTDTLEELFDVATVLASQELPSGRNVAVLSNAGGPAILAADALEASGMHLPPLSEATVASLREFLPEQASLGNPVDMIASASPAQFGRALSVLGNVPEVDIVLVVFITAAGHTARDVARALIEARATLPPERAVVSVFMSELGSTRGLVGELAEAGIPSFAFPEAAARAIGRVATYADWRRRPPGRVVVPEGIDRAAARAALDRATRLATDDGWFDAEAAAAVLRAYGIPLARTHVVRTPKEAARAQTRIGGPVAVKLAAPVHKAELDGIRLGVSSPRAARRAVKDLRASLGRQGMIHLGRELLVQEMVSGVEMVVGITHDPSFGPLVMVGMGGTLVELLRDVSVRATPLTDQDVTEMLGELRLRPVLDGYRGAPRADVAALTDLVHRVGALAEDLPRIAELDLNPVFVGPVGTGVRAVDVRLRVAPT